MLDDRPLGEVGLKVPCGGGGVADKARGEEWFEGGGDNAGEEGRGDP